MIKATQVGQPCRKCGTAVVKEDVSQRSLAKTRIEPINFSLINELHLKAKEYLACPSIILSSWDQQFLRSILRFRRLSEKQRDVLDKIFCSYALPVKAQPRRLENNFRQVQCRCCGEMFELLPLKPGLRDICIRCLHDHSSSREHLYVNASAQTTSHQIV
jgi:hypothetical protein